MILCEPSSLSTGTPGFGTARRLSDAAEAGGWLVLDPADLIVRGGWRRRGDRVSKTASPACYARRLERWRLTDEVVDSYLVHHETGEPIPDEIPMRHRSPHFGHDFSSESYAAGYYGYIWADVLTADATEAFAEAPGGFYDNCQHRKSRCLMALTAL